MIGLLKQPEPPRPLYARVLRLRQLNPSGATCFLFLEGSALFGLVLALAELVPWWAIVVLPLLVAVMVKVNDAVAAAVLRAAAHVPEQEQERFRRETGLGAGGRAFESVGGTSGPRAGHRARHHGAGAVDRSDP
ncbi:MAG TPA: hypothetical protein VFX60_14240 [Micromonospora sp.]|nr:hypothetical protein [Micromonospora sp.]